MLAYWKYKMSLIKIQCIELKPLFWHLPCLCFDNRYDWFISRKGFCRSSWFLPWQWRQLQPAHAQKIAKIKGTRVERGVKSLRCLDDQLVGTLARGDSWIAKNGVIMIEAEHNLNSEFFLFLSIWFNKNCC